MKSILKKVLALVPYSITRALLISKYGYENVYYSQFGEDIILKNIFQDKKKGFYIDVGAHHPERFSNTHLLYQNNWRGINIDANPASMTMFEKNRPRDINIACAVAENVEEKTLYSFVDPALNTISETLADEYEKSGHTIVEKIKITSQPLRSLLKDNLPKHTHIDLLTIDAEEFDLEVLASNDWDLYRPDIICAEDMHFDTEHPEKSPVWLFLKEKGYNLKYSAQNSIFFKNAR